MRHRDRSDLKAVDLTAKFSFIKADESTKTFLVFGLAVSEDFTRDWNALSLMAKGRVYQLWPTVSTALSPGGVAGWLVP
jgi:hypothetical protein